MLFFTLTLIEQIIQSLESSLLSFGTPNKVLMHPQPVKDWLSTVRFGYSGKGKVNTEAVLNDLVGSIHHSSYIFPRPPFLLTTSTLEAAVREAEGWKFDAVIGNKQQFENNYVYDPYSTAAQFKVIQSNTVFSSFEKRFFNPKNNVLLHKKYWFCVISSQNPEILEYQAFLDRYGVDHCLSRPIKPIDIYKIPEKNSTSKLLESYLDMVRFK